MRLGRAFFLWQFIAAAVLPIWLLVGYALSGGSVSGFVGVVLVVPVVIVVEVGLALLLSARQRVRRSRSLDRPAIGLLAAFQLAVVGFGFFGPATVWFGVVASVVAIAGFWVGGALLARDVRTRVQQTLDALGRPPGPRTPIDRGEYVVVKPSR